MKIQSLLLLIVGCQSLTCAAKPEPSHRLMDFLTSPEIAGREAGTPEAARVADSLAAIFARLGLKPAGTDGYFQPFVTEAPRIDSAHTFVRLYIEEDASQRELFEATLGNGLFFFPKQGRSQILEAPLLNGGYGILAPEFKREDYSPQMAKGKILMLSLGAPSDSAFRPGGAGFRYSLSQVKSRVAQENGAVAVLFVQAAGDAGRLQKEIQTRQQDFDPRILQLPEAVPFPVLYMDSLSGTRIQREYENSKGRASASINLAFTMEAPRTLRNVAAIVQGSDQEEASEIILLGAHYDHLGRRHGTYYPGADDNASGIVALLEAAEAFATRPLARSLLFVCFDGEEKGLLGSKWLSSHPLEGGAVAAMINLDCEGRIASGPAPMGSPLQNDDSQLTVFYSKQAPWIEEELKGVALTESLRVIWSSQPVFHEFSDHASFHAKKIPSMFFFGGAHGDYHKPTDSPDKIEWDLLGKRIEFLIACLDRLGNVQGGLEFVEGEGKRRP